MNTEILKRLLAFIVLCLVQALILNRIRLFGFATPLLPVYFVITFHRGYLPSRISQVGYPDMELPSGLVP